MIKRDFLLLLLIFLIGTALRLWRLGEIPIGLHRDEAFLGYNTYSILKTARDISGHFLPLHLESFIYSPAGYSYFSVPFVAIFGLSAFSVRFASALFGSATIILIFSITKILFEKSKNNSLIGLLSSFLFAISPWHINLSRTATENVVVVFFITLGVVVLLIWQRINKWYLLTASFVSFVSTLLIYQAPRAFLPLFIPFMTGMMLRSSFSISNIKKLFPLIVLFLATILLPLSIILSSKNLSLRIRTVSIFESQETRLTLDQYIREDGVSGTPIFTARIFHNKVIGYSSEFLKNYFSHFSYDFLFTDKGFPDRYRVPGVGLLYFLDLPLVLIGAWNLARKEKKVGSFLLGWILLAPVGSALAFDDVPNLQRTLVVFPALSIISAYGLFYLGRVLSEHPRGGSLIASSRNWRKLSFFVVLLFGMIAIYNFIFYLHQYYIHGRVYRPWYRQDGYKSLVSHVNELLPGYKKAVITNRESAPTIFFLFYGKYNPVWFQQETKNTEMRDFDRIGFSKYEFSQDECPLRVETRGNNRKLIGGKGVLYVNSALCEIPEGTNLLSTIRRVDNSEVFHVLEVE